ncbi:MAG: hypothetical protein JSU58_11260, partial [Dehalococcoidales bacterium]
GIHGREYISTSVDLGRKLNHLVFDSENNLVSKLENLVTISVPVVFDMTEHHLTPELMEAVVKAAKELDTFVIIPVAEITQNIENYSNHIIPLLSSSEIENRKELINKVRLVAIDFSKENPGDFPSIKDTVTKLGNTVTIVRVPAVKNVATIVTELAANGAEVIHVVADYRGRGVDGSAGSDDRCIKDIIQDVHTALLTSKIRDEVTIMVSGGIALAEHVAKAMLCGADLTAIDIPLLVGLGTIVYEEPEKSLVMPEGLDQISLPTIVQRIVNLIGAWHSQILEVMGAMGIRDIRRLRGETGRAMFFDEIEKETFGKIFSGDKR